jgi:hypothetical protein
LNEPAVVPVILQVIKKKVQKHEAKFVEENQQKKKGSGQEKGSRRGRET